MKQPREEKKQGLSYGTNYCNYRDSSCKFLVRKSPFDSSFKVPNSIPATANTVFCLEGDFAQDCACAEWILLWRVRQTHSGFHRYYTQMSAKFLISWMRFIISNDLYTAHHNSLGICHQLKIRHLYGTFNFSTQCICMGTRSLFVYGFCGKARPLQRNTVFAVVRIEFGFIFTRLLRKQAAYKPSTEGTNGLKSSLKD